MNIPDKLPHIRESDIPMLSRYAEKEGNPIYPVPRLMDRRELERFYVMAALNVGETGGMETEA